MKQLGNLLVLALSVAAASCTSNNPPDQPTRALSRVADPTAAATPTPVRPAIENPRFPQGAMYTIHCATYTGINHIAQAKAMKEELLRFVSGDARTRGLTEWYVIHSEGESSLNYGYYGDLDNNDKELTRMHADQKGIAGLINTQSGERLFPLAQRVALDTGGDSEGPAEWQLKNARGAWSLEVMAFVSGNRKHNAVEYCREARKAGYEAYYYHGETISSVCIKSWPENSIRIVEPDKVDNPHAVPLVLAPGVQNIDPNIPMLTPDGRPVEVVQRRVNIVDPDMLATMKECPYHGIDGVVHERKQRGQTKGVKDSSFIVRIPKGVPGFDPNRVPGDRAVGGERGNPGAMQPAPGERGRPPVDSRGLPSLGGN